MRKINVKKHISKLLIAVTVLCLTAQPVEVFAKTSQELKKEEQALTNKANAIQSQKNAAQSQLNALDNELVNLLADIRVLEGEIATNEAEIKEAKINLAAAEEAERQQYEAMKLRISYMYEREEKSLFTIFMEAGSMADFLNQVDYATAVQDYDRQLLTNYQGLVQDISEMKAELEQEQQSLQAKKSQLSAKQSSLNSMIAAKRQEVSNFDQQLVAARKAAEAKAKEAAAKRAEEERKARIAAAQAAARAAAEAEAKRKAAESAARAKAESESRSNSNSGSGASEANAASTKSESINPVQRTNVSGSSVVSYANQFVGNPYVWAGNSLTNGIDCSGFVVQVYGHFGINLSGSRQSSLLRSVGQPVSFDSMQPGDIVCYPGHVAIYAGGGKIVEAQSSSTGITNYRDVTCHTILAIRRVV